MNNRFKRILSCISFLGLFLMSFTGLEAKAVTNSAALDISASAREGMVAKYKKAPLVLYPGMELKNKDSVKLAGYYSHRSHYSHSSHSSHYSSRY